MTLDGAKLKPKLWSTVDYESLFEAEPSWANIRWTMLTLSKDRAEHRATVRVMSTAPSRRRLVVVTVNWSERAMERTRSRPVAKLLP